VTVDHDTKEESVYVEIERIPNIAKALNIDVCNEAMEAEGNITLSKTFNRIYFRWKQDGNTFTRYYKENIKQLVVLHTYIHNMYHDILANVKEIEKM